MKFVATARGYLGDRLIEPGTEFEADAKFKASWAVKAKDYKAETEEKSEKDLQKEAVEGLQGKKDKAASEE